MLSVTLTLLLAATSAAIADAPASPLWGQLEPGPYAVGFRQWQRYDYGRIYQQPRKLDGSPRNGELARPMQINIWYPAAQKQDAALFLPIGGAGSATTVLPVRKRGVPRRGTPMTLGDYFDMLPNDRHFNAVTQREKDAATATFIRQTAPEALTPEIQKRARTLAGRALRDAAVAKGQFPVILYSLFSTAMSPATAEYIASHGYVVVTMPRLPPVAGLPETQLTPSDIDAKVRDMDFLLAAMHEFPSADLSRVGVVGFSAGGIWGLSQAMRNPNVRALVSIDSVMLFNEDGQKAWRTLSFFDLDAVRAPILHIIRKEWVPREDPKVWDALRHSERISLEFQDPVLTHWDFQSIGYAMLQAGARASAAKSIEAAFLLFNRYTLAFFEAHVRGDAKAREWLARTPEVNGAPSGFVAAAARKAEPAPHTQAELLNGLASDVDAVLVAYREDRQRFGAPPLSEAVVNQAGYGLIFEGRAADAVRLFELNVETFPASSNACDSLGDAYIEAGDMKRAREMAERTLALVEADTSLTPERRKQVRDAAEEKLRRLP